MPCPLEKYCLENGHRLTKPRQAVYGVITQNNTPIGAYEIIEKLSSSKSSPKPPTIYRALDFLLKHHFVHRIESLNAYITCNEDHTHGGSQFIICDECKTVEEIHLCHVPKDIDAKISTNGFQMSYWSAEIHGVCQACSA